MTYTVKQYQRDQERIERAWMKVLAKDPKYVERRTKEILADALIEEALTD